MTLNKYFSFFTSGLEIEAEGKGEVAQTTWGDLRGAGGRGARKDMGSKAILKKKSALSIFQIRLKNSFMLQTKQQHKKKKTKHPENNILFILP